MRQRGKKKDRKLGISVHIFVCKAKSKDLANCTKFPGPSVPRELKQWPDGKENVR